LKKRLGVLSVVTLLVTALFALSTWATTAEVFFSTDKNGQNRVASIQEGSEIWVVVFDADQNIDCNLRDKMSPDLKIMDPKTGAYIVWNAQGTQTGSVTTFDYLEETGADTGLFVSARSFQVGTREDFSLGSSGAVYDKFTHVVDTNVDDFQWGHYLYGADTAKTGDLLGHILKNVGAGNVGKEGAFGSGLTWAAGKLEASNWALPHTNGLKTSDYMIGRFENMDTLIGMYQDPNEKVDVAITMGKIVDTVSTITWDKTTYPDALEAATITVTDLDENLNCNEIEYVPVFIMVNPGSWNVQTPADKVNVTSFCDLKRLGGYAGTGWSSGTCLDRTGFTPGDAKGLIRWYNIYEQRFIQLPTDLAKNVNTFDTTNAAGWVPVTFWAQETGVSTGVFQLNLNSILCDLGFDSLNVRDVLVAYYLDPNDEDDFSLSAAYIEEKQHSITSFTDATRQDKKLFWLGRDPVYVQVIDANANTQACCPEQVLVNVCDPHGEDDNEWLILDEMGNSSPVFFTNGGMQLQPVWDALGVGLSTSGNKGGFQLMLDNWKLEAFNEDHIYAQYNDVWYATGLTGIGGLGDEHSASTTDTAFPPEIRQVMVANDVSFDLMLIGDTQVYDGQTVNMAFLDRQGGEITAGYTNSDGVFIQVIDPDQDEDQGRRERIDAYWDGGQNAPFGPQQLNPFICTTTTYPNDHFVNALLGDTNVFNDAPASSLGGLYLTGTSKTVAPRSEPAGWPKIYVLNPRSGRWAAVDLMETGVSTGKFVSVICVDLVSRYNNCEPTLNVLPGDTVLAFYQDPSNHSDSAMISIKVGVGGGGTPVSQQSTTVFANASGATVTSYTDADLVYVKVVDPSHNGQTTLVDAVTIGAVKYAVTHVTGTPTDTFITTGLDLNLTAGMTITATYKDPNDPNDTSSRTILIGASELIITGFYAAPTPSDGDVTFAYRGSGVAETLSVEIYDLFGHMVWSDTRPDTATIVWNGKDENGVFVANGVYRYFVTATGGTTPFSDNGIVVINR
jgi:hypothetical protein